MEPRALTRDDYARLAAFRHTLLRFLKFSERAARGQGLASAQYLALLAIEGTPGGSLSVGELAVSLQISHHSAVGLLDRLERAGLARRGRDPEDGRKVRARLTARGRRAFPCAAGPMRATSLRR